VLIAKDFASTTIDIYGSGTLRGTSTSNFTGWATGITAGSEISTTGAHTYGSVSSLPWRDPGGLWHDGWYSGSSTAVPFNDQPGSPQFWYWTSTYNSFGSGNVQHAD